MPLFDQALPYLLCALCGALLALFELIRAFGKWIGRYGFNKFALLLVFLNAATACLVYAFLRYVLGVESTLWLVIVTGFTFPALLRSKLTFVDMPADRSADKDHKPIALPFNEWYRRLQTLCIDEVNSHIAVRNRKQIKRLRDKLGERKMLELLKDHVAGETIPEKQELHNRQIAAIESLADADDRLRRLGRLILDLMPDTEIEKLLKEPE